MRRIIMLTIIATLGVTLGMAHAATASAATCSNYTLYPPGVDVPGIDYSIYHQNSVAFSWQSGIVTQGPDQAECSVNWFDKLDPQYLDAGTWHSAHCNWPLGTDFCVTPTPAPGAAGCDNHNAYCANTLVSWGEWDFPIHDPNGVPFCSFQWRVHIRFFNDATGSQITAQNTPTNGPVC